MRARWITTIVSTAVVLAMGGDCMAQRAPAPPQQPPVTGGVFGGKRPLDADRASQQLSTNFTAAGGYDQDLDAENGDLIMGPRQTGYLAALAGGIDYRFGTTTKFLDASVNARSSRATAGVREMTAGDAGVRASTSLGRRMGFHVDASTSYQPTFLFAAFAPVQPIVADPELPQVEVSPTQGTSEQRWLASGGSAVFYRNVTTRQRTEMTFATSQRQPLSGIGYDSASQIGAVRHEWRRWQNASLQFSYRYDQNRQDLIEGRGQPLRYHTGDVEFRVRHSIAPGRAFEFALGGGATRSLTTTRVERPGSDFTSPTGTVMASIGLTRSWTLSTDGRRGITVLEGLNPEPFLTDVATIQLDGNPSQSVRFIASGGYSHGRARVTHAGEFESLTGLAELRYHVSRFVELTGTYTYYGHALRDVLVLQPSFPSQYHLSSARIGVTFWLPLYGTFRE